MTEDEFTRYPSLSGKVVLITGGGSGLGASMVEHFAHQGAKVAFLDVAKAAAKDLVAKLTAYSPFFVCCDLTDISALQAAIRAAEETLGPIDALVNNAANDE